MNEFILFLFGVVLGAASSSCFLIPVTEFYKGRYEQSMKLLKIIESEINKNMEEEK